MQVQQEFVLGEPCDGNKPEHRWKTVEGAAPEIECLRCGILLQQLCLKPALQRDTHENIVHAGRADVAN